MWLQRQATDLGVLLKTLVCLPSQRGLHGEESGVGIWELFVWGQELEGLPSLVMDLIE